MSIKRLVSMAAIVAGSAILSGPAAAAFMPVIDEFWIVRNGSEQFRDSFNDGVLPPSGPQDGLGGNPDTYSMFGAAGMTSEAGGKLTMTPSLGDPVLISGGLAETFTGALKIRSTNPTSGNFLGPNQSFEIHGLFDMSNLPTVSSQRFGIRATDRATTLGLDGNDTVDLSIAKSTISGDIIVRLAEYDFSLNASTAVEAFSIESLLGVAEQIELILSKDAVSDMVTASFNLWGAGGFGGALLMTHAMTASIKIFEDEAGQTSSTMDDFARAQFFSVDGDVPVSEPGALTLVGLGLAGFGALRRRRSGAR